MGEQGARSRERIALYALLTSLTAVSIDIILPAYPILARDFYFSRHLCVDRKIFAV